MERALRALSKPCVQSIAPVVDRLSICKEIFCRTHDVSQQRIVSARIEVHIGNLHEGGGVFVLPRGDL